jgi:monoamine oxidase
MDLTDAGEARVNGDISFWWADVRGPPGAHQRRPALDGRLEADVCIVGGGYTGLWAAYYLARAAPDLRVVVLEADASLLVRRSRKVRHRGDVRRDSHTRDPSWYMALYRGYL